MNERIREENGGQDAPVDDPGSWNDRTSKENFDELDAVRRKRRGYP